MGVRNTRRDFLKTTAVAGVGFWVAGGVSPKPSRAANEEIGFACIGIDGKGASDSQDAGRHGNIVAIVDIDDQKLDKAAKFFPNAKKFNDYRKMYDEMHRSIDAVTVSTPDHNHAAASIMGMKLGKHCFCQKPLTHSLYEARRMGEVAREMKVATQMGNQGTAGATLRRAAAVVKSGVLGKITEVHVWTNRPIWPQGGPRPAEATVPDYVHWDLWLGPAPERPYGNGYHPFAWRGWWDFGTGALGDMACHTLNMPYMALDLKHPTSVQATTSGHNKDSYPQRSKIRYEFPGTDARGPIVMYWYDGKNLPGSDLIDGEQPKESGVIVVGDKARLYAPGDYAENKCRILSKDTIEDPEVEFKRSPGHFEEWVQAIKGGEPAMSNFADYSGPLTETVLLGNLAVWAAAEADSPGKKIEWDAKKLVAKNAPEVAHVVKREYRSGWSI
ncbi:MAG: Gfo/Idh/MocA family oxidoreductase [Planctomycetia bacterium]|nr:Gfo/Idh/MocA family oxidoreductase [Planctomycetia bacterium]